MLRAWLSRWLPVPKSELEGLALGHRAWDQILKAAHDGCGG